MADHVRIFDTTLRDGEQAAGVSYTNEQKLQIAKMLEKLNVDIIEAGFAAASPGDFDAVSSIAREIRGATITTLCRAVPGDIEQGYEAVRGAEDPRIHVFLSSSDIHMAHQLHKDREEVLTLAREMVGLAASKISNVEFSPMDATRSEPEFVHRMLKEVIAAGATTINIPDTVGYAIPQEYEAFLRGILEDVPGMDRVTLSVHCQNDLGLATANSLAGVLAGARQVECTINGIGERAGNASLEEVVMAIKTRPEFMQVETRVNTQFLVPASRMVEDLSGVAVQHNKAIVGLNAFRHQSGIHQDGVVKLRETYEIMDPKSVGWKEGTRLVLSKLSGRAGFRARLQELGYDLGPEDLNRAFMKFQELADRKTEVEDRDLEAIVADRLGQSGEEFWQLKSVSVTTGTDQTPTASIKLLGPNGEIHTAAETGHGPVDAVYRTIRQITGMDDALTEFSVQSITEGIDAQGQVTIRIDTDGQTFTGRSSDTDILVASARAYMNAINRALNARAAVAGESSGG